MNSLRLSIDEVVAEFVGMFCIVFVTSLTEMSNKDPSITGIVLFLLYSFFNYATLRFSAAHLNPAVSLTYLLTKEITVIKFVLYVGAQMAASFAAGFLLLFFRSFERNSLGHPWLGKFKETGENVVSPIQGSGPLISVRVGDLHQLLPHVRSAQEHMG